MELPLLTAALDDQPRVFRHQVFPSQRGRFLAAVATVERHIAAGSIPNPAFVEAKVDINRAFEKAWDQIADRHINNGRYLSLPEQVLAFWHLISTPQLHTVAGYLKRATKVVRIDHPVQADVIALLREMAPLAAMFAILKTMVVKRQRKPADEVKEGYEPPPVSTEAQQKVVALLESVTAAAYDRLKALLVESYRNLLVDYMEAQRCATGRLAPYDHFMGRRVSIPNPAALHIIDKVVISDGRGPYQAMPQAKVTAIFVAEATKVADEYRTFFVHKNYRKIASIIDAKGNYQNGWVVGHSVSLSGLTGTLAFSFTDGSSFQVQNNVVDVVNAHHTHFLRFPLTFHNAILPTGERLSQPSQERMNTIFAAR